jgi:small subunit ribosomal protein S9
MPGVFKGSRKFASASLAPIEKGEGILINGLAAAEYFSIPTWKNALQLVRTLEEEFSFKINLAGRISVKGGGKVAQLDAVRYAIFRYIAKKYPETKTKLRSLGELTCDTRRKAPYNLGKARKSPQRNKR